MSSGSNVSIEEIGPDEIEENRATVEDDAEILLPNDAGDFDTEGKKEVAAPAPAEEADDPPLEPLVPPPAAAAPAAADPPAAAVAPAAAPPAAAAPAARPAPRAVAPVAAADDDDEEDDEDIDETIIERLVGLTEMFPESLTNGSVSLVKGTFSMTKSCYSFARSAAWVVFTSATILFLPVMLETERLGLEDQQKQQKTQMLLGPGVASSGAPSLGPPPI